MLVTEFVLPVLVLADDTCCSDAGCVAAEVMLALLGLITWMRDVGGVAKTFVLVVFMFGEANASCTNGGIAAEVALARLTLVRAGQAGRTSVCVIIGLIANTSSFMLAVLVLSKTDTACTNGRIST